MTSFKSYRTIVVYNESKSHFDGEVEVGAISRIEESWKVPVTMIVMRVSESMEPGTSVSKGPFLTAQLQTEGNHAVGQRLKATAHFSAITRHVALGPAYSLQACKALRFAYDKAASTP